MSKLSQHISHFLIGMPASGKSTLAQWLQSHTGAKLISTDEIRAQLWGDRQIQGDWQEIEQEVFRQMREAIALHTPIIYDATNCNGVWRKDFLAKCPPIHWLAWYLQTPLETCLVRNQRRSRQVPSAVIQQMALDLERCPPQQTEGFIDVITPTAIHEADCFESVPESLETILETIFRDLKKQHPEYHGD